MNGHRNRRQQDTDERCPVMVIRTNPSLLENDFLSKLARKKSTHTKRLTYAPIQMICYKRPHNYKLFDNFVLPFRAKNTVARVGESRPAVVVTVKMFFYFKHRGYIHIFVATMTLRFFLVLFISFPFFFFLLLLFFLFLWRNIILQEALRLRVGF